MIMARRCVALLDVDHTLIMGDDSLNWDLINSLVLHDIIHVFLYTDMTLHPPEIENRKGLIKQLEEAGLAVHNVLTPNDITWPEIDPVETLTLHQWAFVERKYNGKFHGPEFEAFVCSQSTELPKLSRAITQYRPELGALGLGFSEACLEMHSSGTVCDATRARSIFAKVLADHLSEKLRYAHCKGLLLDMFLRHCPEWVGSVLVADDNAAVVSDVTAFRPVSSEQMLRLPLPPISVVHITPEGIKQGRSYYDLLMAEHTRRHRASVDVTDPTTESSNPTRPLITEGQISALLTKACAEYSVPALGAAVVTSGGLVASAVVGVRKRGSNVLVTPEDKWHLGSNTKAMTAMLAGQCVVEGTLRWDSRVCDVLPQVLRAAWGDVTLEHCLSHKSGAPANIEWRKAATRSDAVRMITASPPLHAAGSEYLYSNCGYVLVGAMVEAVYGRCWEDLIADRLWRPLGMVDAGVGGMGTKGEVDQPWGHQKNGTAAGNGPFADNAAVLGPAGTAHMPLADWARFVTDQLVGLRGGTALLPTECYCPFRTVFDSSQHRTGVREGYALGWRVVERTWAGRGHASSVLTHTGTNTRHVAVVWVAPDIDFAVLVCCNQESSQEACNATVVNLLKLYGHL